MTGADIRDYFYRLMLPGPLQTYFALPEVEVPRLKSPAARGWQGGSTARPVLLVVPMGWSFALH